MQKKKKMHIPTQKSTHGCLGLCYDDYIYTYYRSGAHTVGSTACFFMTKRLYNFFPGGGSDPAINPALLPELQARCPEGGDVNVRLATDRGSEQTFDDHILQNIREGFAVLESDARLNDDETTKSILDSYFDFLNPLFGPSFETDFVDSFLKMGQIGVKTAFQGEIRHACAAFN
jgi:peroxidase